MYGNGGYLMLDFKNSDLNQDRIKIDGITYNKLDHAISKIIVATNVRTFYTAPILSNFSAILRRESDDVIALYCAVPTTTQTKICAICVNKQDEIYVELSKETSNTLNLESEVSTNASKSDSNISK